MYDAATIRRELKHNTLFSVHNLVSDTVFNEFQLITCRNVFIYFSGATITEIVARFAQQMPTPGYLFVGVSESLLRMTKAFSLEQVGDAYVYVKT